MSDEEALYARAVAIVRESQKGSTSYLQRQLRIGYNSAARLIERMERDGIVAAPDHVGRRAVLALSTAAEVAPWSRNEGKFDTPSSSVPPPFAEAQRPVAAIAEEMVERFGVDGARAVVSAIADAKSLAEEPALASVAAPPDVSADHLRQIVERVEHLFGERDQLAETIRDTFSFAKSIGFDTKGVRAIVKMRAMDKSVRLEGEAVIEVYRHAMGIEGPDFAISLPIPSVPPPPKHRKLTAREKQYREALALTAAARTVSDM